ncbi:MAG: hypothetical protein CM15mP54_19900 [Paracoccaceae bacterium]|nr:MAG: hypothetical protein CM15mP54_19900 [Paracoccaceae bacterium]
MKGYFKQPDETANTINENGWLKTGDLGYMDEDGYIFVTGRIKELIIKGGENIAPEKLTKHYWITKVYLRRRLCSSM